MLVAGPKGSTSTSSSAGVRTCATSTALPARRGLVLDRPKIDATATANSPIETSQDTFGSAPIVAVMSPSRPAVTRASVVRLCAAVRPWRRPRTNAAIATRTLTAVASEARIWLLGKPAAGLVNQGSTGAIAARLSSTTVGLRSSQPLARSPARRLAGTATRIAPNTAVSSPQSATAYRSICLG